MMGRITLEFLPRPRVPWFGLLFLLLSMVVAAIVLGEWISLRRVNEQRKEHIQTLELALQQQRTELEVARKKRDVESAQTLKAYAPILSSLNYPWNQVFGEIEAASGKDIALLSFTHDQATATTHLTVETLELPAMSQFVGRLNGDETDRWYISSYHLQPQSNPPTIRGEITRR